MLLDPLSPGPTPLQTFASYAIRDEQKFNIFRGLPPVKPIPLSFNGLDTRNRLLGRDDNRMRRELNPAIEACHHYLCMVGEDMSIDEDWISMEIRLADEAGLALLAMTYWDAPKVRAPAFLVRHGVRPHRWDLSWLVQQVSLRNASTF